MQPLLKVGPFLGLDATKEDYYIEPGMGNQASNVDISAYPGGFTSALGRNLFATLAGVPNTYTIKCVAQFTSFVGTTNNTTKRVYVFSAVSGSNSYQGYYDPAIAGTVQLSSVTPFTQAVQFGSYLWVNSGFKLNFNADGSVGWDQWQITVPYQYAYNVQGTYAVTAGNAPVDTYTYAITLRRGYGWTNPDVPVGRLPNGGSTTLTPRVTGYQESSPIYTTSVTIAAGQQPGFTASSGLSLANLISGTTLGGQNYYGALYRSRNGNPTYQFVDYLYNLTQMNDHNGVASIIDTYSDAQITSNAILAQHDPPPMQGMTFSGFGGVSGGNPASVAQSTAKASFVFTNPCFVTKHKNRMFAFTLYPTDPLTNAPSNPNQTTLDPQLWYSDANTPWSFNASQQVLRVGAEDTPGNYNVDTNSSPPWTPGALEDTPMGLASAGSYLVLFKSQTVWTLLGDSPSEWNQGGLKRSFDIGCSASASITTAEGGVFWLAPTGVYFFNGGSPTYIGEDVRGYIESLPWSQQQAAVGSYRDRTFYLSFPNATLAYYTPSQKWYLLPYGASAAVFSPANQNSLIVANGNQLQTMNANAATDLGSAITSIWQSNVTDCGSPGQLSTFRMFYLVAPRQLGTATMRLDLDIGFAAPKSYSWTWDMSLGNGAFVHSLPKGAVGYNAQLTITTTTNASATAPIIIRAGAVLGTVDGHALGDTSLDDKSGALNGVLHG